MTILRCNKCSEPITKNITLNTNSPYEPDDVYTVDEIGIQVSVHKDDCYSIDENFINIGKGSLLEKHLFNVDPDQATKGCCGIDDIFYCGECDWPIGHTYLDCYQDKKISLEKGCVIICE